ncbi:MAG: S41 family peptidase [Candidatus Peribacteraceae bacterium]|nr:S41 family peptidase [Candidatus Peribacteraceae bacterium]
MSKSFSRLSARVFSVSIIFFLVLPSTAGAAAISTLLNARDTQTVTRADFIRAAVKAADIPLPQESAVPYNNVPEAFLPYVRAAHARGALKIFEKEGRGMRFTQGIRRGEAVDILSHLLQVVQSGSSDPAAKKFTDAVTAADRQLVSLALERNWLKPLSDTVFGLKRPLRGKEGTLLLTRAFQIQTESAPTETLSAPIIRVKLQSINTESAPKGDMLQNIWNVLRRSYLYRDRLSVDKAGDKAIQGLVDSLGDPYTTYMPKEKNEDFKLQMKGEVEGIGATVEMTGGVLRIVSPLRSSPAEKAGLKPKDEILSVNGETLRGLTLDEAVRKVRGPKGSAALLKVRRDGNEFEVSVTREKVVIPEVEITEDRNVSVVRIVQFWDTTDKKFSQAMAEVQTKNPRGINLDLRNNPGGLLHAAGVVVGTFLPKSSPFVSIMESDVTRTEITDDEPTVSFSVPMIVLVNKGSASASEIVAGALQDSKRAKIVGETTYGKGTVQQVMQFTDGSSLKYTVAEWRTPLGHKIDKIGVVPDVVVSNEGAPVGRDLQMEKAMELLR